MSQEPKDTQPNAALGDTSPNAARGDTNPNPAQSPARRFPRWLAIVLFGALIVIGAVGGYGTGMGRRSDAQKTQVSAQMQEQLELGLRAMDVGQYEVARQHLQFILEQAPDFPGAQEAYADLLFRIQTSPTPTYTATPTITPTPDLRSAEEQFANAQQLLSARDWNGTISALDSLRKMAPTYRAAEVDGMYYTALRMRGFLKISNTDCQQINLEGGIYDLTLAERFGPLDANAEALRSWARMYIAGASFWDQDWIQVQEIFFQVKSALPNLSDSSCESATERWRFATIKRAEILLAQNAVCASDEQFAAAFSVPSQRNQPYFGTATQVHNRCRPPTQVPPPATKTPTGAPPADTPTETPG
jgi:hypothetical protein